MDQTQRRCLQGSPAPVAPEYLIGLARAARDAAYAPYSHFPVGAALLAAGGTIYTGCNVENAVYGLGVCAERNALFHAVAQGARRFEAIAVVSERAVAPCGACRQVLAEFGPDLTVIVSDGTGDWRSFGLSELLPNAFGPADLTR